MSRNIVILSGSPRKNGNTDKLVAAFVEGAESAGKSVKLFRTADMGIAGCLGCGHCHKNDGECVQKDDMPEILEALKVADTLVLASPVYYFSVTAQLKLAIDRTYALLRRGTPRERIAMLLTCGNPDTSVAEGAIILMNWMCKISKSENAGVIVAGGLHDVDAIVGRPELEQARELGKSI